MATLRNVLIALWVSFVGMEIHVATTAAIRACGECFRSSRRLAADIPRDWVSTLSRSSCGRFVR